MMRSLLLAALGITAFSATMAVETPQANAVVYCAAGVYRAGCVARPGVASVRGVARRTTRRVVRRSDMMLKHDISLLGHLDNGLGFYRFSYNGSDKAYVGVMAQRFSALALEEPSLQCSITTSRRRHQPMLAWKKADRNRKFTPGQGMEQTEAWNWFQTLTGLRRFFQMPLRPRSFLVLLLLSCP